MQSQDNPIDKAILAATNEQLQEPDMKLMKDVADLINSRSDIPKLAIIAIGKRLQLLRNTKVLLLTLELIEYCTYLCETTFYTQISTSDFLLRFQILLKTPMNSQVQQRGLQVLAPLKQLMGSNPDLFPTFFQFLAKVQAKGIHQYLKTQAQIPTNYESKYVTLRKQQVYSKPSSYHSIATGSENPKTAKLKKDLEIVKSNILLTNEIIDNSNPQEDASKNDILTDMVKTLKGVEDKLRSLITNMTGSDEVMMSYCLELNDDLLKTFERYEALKKHRKPNPFKMEQFAFSNQFTQQPAQQAPIQAQIQDNKNVDWTKFSQMQIGGSTTNNTNNLQAQSKPVIEHKQIDLLDLFEDTGPAPNANQSSKPPQQSQQIELLSIDLSPSLQTNVHGQQQQQQQIQQQQSGQISQGQGQFGQQQQQPPQPQQIQNIQSLYNMQPPQVPQQPQQAPANKYAVFNQQGSGMGMQGQAGINSMQQQGMLQQQQNQQQQQMLQQQQRGQPMGQFGQPSNSFQSQPQGQAQLSQFGMQGNQQSQQPQGFANSSQSQPQFQQQGQFQQQQVQSQPQYQQQQGQVQYPQQQQFPNNFQQQSFTPQVPAVNQNPKQPFDALDDLFGGSITKKPANQPQQKQSGFAQSDLI